MDKKNLALLERAFEAEVVGAISGSPRFMQTKDTTRADELVAYGLLTKCVEYWRGLKLEGYELTLAGHFVYCTTCKDCDESSC